ncbi:MAG: VanZ family protein [Burkholderiales bacterium]|jgi:VanZ family protein|nr:VanZ family protein [Burkholderiales bacterium]
MLAAAVRMSALAPARIAAGVVGALFVATLLQQGAQPYAVGLFPAPWDKVAHFVAFFGFGGLVAIAAGRRGLWWAAAAAAMALGAVDEWHQTTLPGRMAGWDDWLVDAGAGIAAGAVHATLMRRHARW